MAILTDKSKKPAMAMVYVFLIINAIVITLRRLFNTYQIDYGVVMVGNIVLFLIALFTFTKSARALDNPNPHAFVRSYYAGFLIRLLLIAGIAFIYIYLQDGKINKAALFICMGIYAIYSAIEVSALRKILNEKKNA